MEYMESMMNDRLEASMSEYEQMSDRIKQLEQELAEAKKCESLLKEICAMQRSNFGHATHTHLDLIDLCKKAKEILAIKEISK